jgi:DNA-binding transcriptional MerR regulator
MAQAGSKSEGAFRTIGELAADLGVPQHVLRYWETRFPQLKPLQRAGNRRYYRPADVALAQRIYRLLNHDGYTIRGVQQLLAGRPIEEEAQPLAAARNLKPPAEGATAPSLDPSARDELRRIRDTLASALSSGV